jgi:hypothetical protein
MRAEMVTVAKFFHDALRIRTGAAEATTRLAELLPDVTFSNG